VQQSRPLSDWWVSVTKLATIAAATFGYLGQLPFLIHDQHTVTTLALIIKYVAGLKSPEFSPNANLEAPLDQRTKSQNVAWCAHVESTLGDIVASLHALLSRRHVSYSTLQYYTMYSHHGNWAGLTGLALASMFPVPQRYYVPARIRESYRPRLEAVGMWNLPDVEKEGKKPFKENSKKTTEKNTHVFLQAFEREKVRCKFIPFIAGGMSIN
jgi:sorting and assembly machinery component 37